MAIFRLDGVEYDKIRVPEEGIKRSFAVLDGDNAGRVMSGRMVRDIIGTYYNYSLSGAYLPTQSPPIQFTLRDEPGGSGVNPASLALRIDGVQYGSTSSGMELMPVTNGYDGTFTPPALLNGQRTVTVQTNDNDGNLSNLASVTFIIDTEPPTLNVTSPVDGLITAEPSQVVEGVTNDALSPTVTVTISKNGIDQGAVAVQPNGSFSKPITLTEGNNAIVVRATDVGGTSTTITHNVTLDTTAPEFKSISITPNPADAGSTLIITLEVE